MCDVLNAKNDAYEAQIIAQAGKLGAVTISTNMAGRGTDIRLGGLDEQEKAQVVALGGLYVIGTNKHESQRIDKQLRGRAGRQGDPGSSRFFISLEDDLFLKYRLHDLLPLDILNDRHQTEINNAIIRREIDRLQSIIEGQNLEIKKTLCKYSSMIEQQRKIMWDKREDVLNTSSVSAFFESNAPEKFYEYRSFVGEKHLGRLCQNILLYCIDTYWSQHLADIADIRESIHLHRIGGQDPYFEFQKLAVAKFADLLRASEDEAIHLFTTMQISGEDVDNKDRRLKTPSATWTYLINDDPFEHQLVKQLLGNIGISTGAAFMWPLMLISLIVNRLKRKNP
jgi:preprotein translocase subunit SecA